MLEMLSRNFCTENLGSDCLVGGMCVVEHGIIVFIIAAYFIKIFKSMSINCIIKLYPLYVRYMNGDYSLK